MDLYDGNMHRGFILTDKYDVKIEHI